MGIASLIMGIVGLFGLIPVVGWFFILFNILAILLGFISLMINKENKSERSMAVAGIILGSIPIVIKVVVWVFIFIASLSSGTY